MHKNIKKIMKLGVPFVSTIAAMYGAWSGGGDIAGYFTNIMAGNIFYDSLKNIFLRLDDGEDPENFYDEIVALNEPKNKAALFSVLKEIEPVLNQVIDNLPKSLSLELKKSFESELKNFNRLLQEYINIDSTISFPVYNNVSDLINANARIRNFGVSNVIDRPETEAIISAFRSFTKLLIIEGRALSGKSFLAFLVAKRWLKTGGKVAWLNEPLLDKWDLKRLSATGEALIVWDQVEPSKLGRKEFALLQSYEGPVLITTRIGDRSPNKENWDDEYEDFLEHYGITKVRLRNTKLVPITKNANLFLSAVNDPGKVISATAAALFPKNFTIHKEFKEEIIKRITVYHKKEKTTILGLARAYLMIAHKLGKKNLNKNVIKKIEGSYNLLQDENLIKNIFVRPLQKSEINIIWAIRRLRDWTSNPLIHSVILQPTLKAHDLKRPYGIEELIESGFILHERPWYSIWHDMQLDVLGDDDQLESENTLLKTVEFINQWLNNTKVFSEKEIDEIAVVLNFATELLSNYRVEASAKLFNNLLGLQTQIDKSTPSKLILITALSLLNTASFFAKVEEYSLAIKGFEESLVLLYLVSLKHPATYHYELFCAHYNLALAYREKEIYDEAIINFKHSLPFINSLYLEGRNDIYGADYANSLSNLGFILLEKEEKNEAFKKLKKALSIYKKLPKSEQKKYLHSIAGISLNLAKLIDEIKDGKISKRQLLSDAVNNFEILVLEDQNKWEDKLADAYYSYGLYFAKSSDFTNASDFFIKAYTIFSKRVYEKKIETELLTLNLVRSNLAKVNIKLKDYKRAKDLLKLSLKDFLILFEAENSVDVKEYIEWDLRQIEELVIRIKVPGCREWISELWNDVFSEFGRGTILACYTFERLFLFLNLYELALEPIFIQYFFLKNSGSNFSNEKMLKEISNKLEQTKKSIGQNSNAILSQLEKKLQKALAGYTPSYL